MFEFGFGTSRRTPTTRCSVEGIVLCRAAIARLALVTSLVRCCERSALVFSVLVLQCASLPFRHSINGVLLFILIEFPSFFISSADSSSSFCSRCLSLFPNARSLCADAPRSPTLQPRSVRLFAKTGEKVCVCMSLPRETPRDAERRRQIATLPNDTLVVRATHFPEQLIAI